MRCKNSQRGFSANKAKTVAAFTVCEFSSSEIFIEKPGADNCHPGTSCLCVRKEDRVSWSKRVRFQRWNLRNQARVQCDTCPTAWHWFVQTLAAADNISLQMQLFSTTSSLFLSFFSTRYGTLWHIMNIMNSVTMDGGCLAQDKSSQPSDASPVKRNRAQFLTH